MVAAVFQFLWTAPGRGRWQETRCLITLSEYSCTLPSFLLSFLLSPRHPASLLPAAPGHGLKVLSCSLNIHDLADGGGVLLLFFPLLYPSPPLPLLPVLNETEKKKTCFDCSAVGYTCACRMRNERKYSLQTCLKRGI